MSAPDYEEYRRRIDASLKRLATDIEHDLYNAMISRHIERTPIPLRTRVYRKLMRPVWAVQRWLVHRLGGVMPDEVDYDY